MFHISVACFGGMFWGIFMPKKSLTDWLRFEINDPKYTSPEFVRDTIWLFNIAMENHHLFSSVNHLFRLGPSKNHGYVSHYQRVCGTPGSDVQGEPPPNIGVSKKKDTQDPMQICQRLRYLLLCGANHQITLLHYIYIYILYIYIYIMIYTYNYIYIYYVYIYIICIYIYIYGIMYIYIYIYYVYIIVYIYIYYIIYIYQNNEFIRKILPILSYSIPIVAGCAPLLEQTPPGIPGRATSMPPSASAPSSFMKRFISSSKA